MLAMIILVFVIGLALFMLAGANFHEGDIKAGLVVVVIAVLFTAIAAFGLHHHGVDSGKAMASNTSADEGGKRYKLITQFSSANKGATGLVLDDGTGNTFVIWSDKPVPSEAKYLQKVTTTKPVNK